MNALMSKLVYALLYCISSPYYETQKRTRSSTPSSVRITDECNRSARGTHSATDEETEVQYISNRAYFLVAIVGYGGNDTNLRTRRRRIAQQSMLGCIIRLANSFAALNPSFVSFLNRWRICSIFGVHDTVDSKICHTLLFLVSRSPAGSRLWPHSCGGPLCIADWHRAVSVMPKQLEKRLKKALITFRLLLFAVFPVPWSRR